MILTIGLGLTSAVLVYRLYTSEKKSQDFIQEFDRINRFNKELEEEIWILRIELQDSKNQTLLAKMSHEKTKQELEDKARTWENQYNAIKNESNRD
jgi:predicted  nucleic acid-binding Zn-ribbon protein